MNDLALKQDASGYRSSVDSRWVICDELGVFTREPVVRFEVVIFALRSTYVHRVRLTQAGRRLDERIEHRLQIERRAADDLEHVGGGGLLLEGFAQLVEQPRILDRNDGLFREIAHKLHLLVAERSHLLPINGYRSDGLVFLEHWHCHVAARAAEFGRVIREKLPFSRSISEEDGSLHADDVLECASDCGLKWSALSDELCERRRDVEFCRRAQSAVFVVEHHAELCFAKSRGVFQHALEYWLKLTGRARNDLQHLGCCGLPLQRFPQLIEQVRVLDGDDGLSGETLDQLDLLIGQQPHLLASKGDCTEQLFVLEHWDCEHSPISGEFDTSNHKRVALDVGRYRRDVGYVGNLLGYGYKPKWRIRGRPE